MVQNLLAESIRQMALCSKILASSCRRQDFISESVYLTQITSDSPLLQSRTVSLGASRRDGHRQRSVSRQKFIVCFF